MKLSERRAQRTRQYAQTVTKALRELADDIDRRVSDPALTPTEIANIVVSRVLWGTANLGVPNVTNTAADWVLCLMAEKDEESAKGVTTE